MTESPLALAREYAEVRYDIAQPELTVFEFDDESLLRFVAALTAPLERELDALKHDIARHIAIASEALSRGSQ